MRHLEHSPEFFLMPPKQREELHSIRIWDLHDESYVVLRDLMSVWAFCSKQRDKALFPSNELRHEHSNQILFPISKEIPPSLRAAAPEAMTSAWTLNQPTEPFVFLRVSRILLPPNPNRGVRNFIQKGQPKEIPILSLIWRYLKLLEILPTSSGGTLLY